MPKQKKNEKVNEYLLSIRSNLNQWYFLNSVRNELKSDKTPLNASHYYDFDKWQLAGTYIDLEPLEYQQQLNKLQELINQLAAMIRRQFQLFIRLTED